MLKSMKREASIAGPEQVLTGIRNIVTEADVTVIIPVLNEEDAVGRVIDEVTSCGFHNILVVDGYSTDMTAKVAMDRGVEVITQHGMGKTGAIRTAIDHVSTPYMLVMDGDLTYNPRDIMRFMNHANGHDLIIGVRTCDNISWLHRLGNRILTHIFNIMFGTSLSDVCSGMYLLRTDSAKELELRTKGFDAEVEIAAQTAYQGTVTEVPIDYRDRVGEKKLSTWVDGSIIFKTIFSLARIYNPIVLFSFLAGFAVLPAVGIISWVLWDWWTRGIFHSGWALFGGILLVLACQAFAVGTISILLKRSEARLARRIKANILQTSA